MDDRGHILCIHYYYPPLRSTAVIRNYHFSQAFAEIFPQVHVLTSDNYKSYPNEKQPLEKNINVHDVYTLDYRTIMGRKKSSDSHLSMGKKKSSGFQFLLKVQKSFPFNLLLGEGNFIYIWNAYRKACKLIKQHNIKVIYSSFAPYADHYVGYLLKKKFPQVKWTADFRDLQIEPIYKNVLFKSLERKVEAKVLCRADRVTSVSEGYTAQFDQYGVPTQTTTRGVEPRPSVDRYSKFTISYTGSLYFDYRDPHRFFKVVQDLIKGNKVAREHIDIIYAGRDGQQFMAWAAECGIEDVVINKGMISGSEAREIQNRSHINLLLTSASPELSGVITGKVFEYFEAGNPILCLISGVKDKEFEVLFEKLNAGVVVYDPEQGSGRMAAFIIKLYEELQQTGSMQHIIEKGILIDEYSWKSQAEKAVNYL